MSKPKKEKEIIAIEDMSPNEKMKYEIATELGLLDKVKESGWKSLSAKETGRIGGIMTKRKKQLRLEEPNKNL
ncbi:MAG: small, acid-soluble spore protein alpha/beta type [Anaerocolumna sp.]|jgi:hypothetical protein|nr:small, acid-soluble spore protein alpha/beta type [Anaerocolumna sp.]